MGLWTPEHIRTLIPSTVFMFILCVALRLVLGKKSLKARMIPFQVLSCIIVIIEIGKQTLSLLKGYDLYHLPFHFCSLFIFMLPLMAFYKGKYSERIRGITAAICASVFVLMLIYPSLIYSASDVTRFFENFFCFHTVAFHNIVMLEFLLIVFLDLHEPSQKDIKPIIVFTVVFNVIAGTMAQLLKTNFNNLYTCNVPPLEALRQSVEASMGVVPTKILYMAIVTVMDVLFVLMSYGIYRLCRAMLSKKKADEKKERELSLT
ncbi:MAG: hypothetical protein E7660_06775 [Ruminococcaceae bacterium]|nr:hypothetical protein [Oscillospiraceae bacterium]